MYSVSLICFISRFLVVYRRLSVLDRALLYTKHCGRDFQRQGMRDCKLSNYRYSKNDMVYVP